MMEDRGGKSELEREKRWEGHRERYGYLFLGTL